MSSSCLPVRDFDAFGGASSNIDHLVEGGVFKCLNRLSRYQNSIW